MSVYYIQSLDPQELANRFSTDDILEPFPQMDEEWKDLHLDKIRMVLDRLPDRESDLIRLYFFLNKKQTDIAEIFGVTQAAVSYRLKRAINRIRFLIELPDVTKEELYHDLVPVMPSTLDAQIFAEMFESTCQSEVATILGISQGRVRHRFIVNLSRMGQVLRDRTALWVSRNDIKLQEVLSIQKHLSMLDEINEKEMEEQELEKHILALGEKIEALPEDLEDKRLTQFSKYYKTFVKIRYNFNILREIKLPKWANRSQKSLETGL